MCGPEDPHEMDHGSLRQKCSGGRTVHVIAPFVNTFLTCMKVSNGVVCVVVTQVVSDIFHAEGQKLDVLYFFNYLFSGFLHLRPIGVTH